MLMKAVEKTESPFCWVTSFRSSPWQNHPKWQMDLISYYLQRTRGGPGSSSGLRKVWSCSWTWQIWLVMGDGVRGGNSASAWTCIIQAWDSQFLLKRKKEMQTLHMSAKRGLYYLLWRKFRAGVTSQRLPSSKNLNIIWVKHPSSNLAASL